MPMRSRHLGLRPAASGVSRSYRSNCRVEDNCCVAILAVRPDHLDRRIALQQSYFTFHVPNNKVLSPAAVLKNFTMCGLKKGAIRKELSLLGINHVSVYGDFEHLTRHLKEAHNVR